MTEVPEHLLQRSRDRRAALGLGGAEDGGIAAAAAPRAAAEVEVAGGAGAAAPATTAATAPATQVAPEAKVEPLAPYVEAGIRRKKIPVWAMPVLAALPIWAIIYAGTLDKATPTQLGPRAEGLAVYGGKGCSGCHGGGGGGGSGPALNNLTKDFSNPADQLYWIMEGSAGFQKLGIATYGDTKKPVQGGMPGWAEALTANELIGVVRHERETFAGDTFSPDEYDKMLAMIKDKYPARVDEFTAAIEEFKVLPPDA